MRSPAAAVAWEFRRRHRWGLMAVAAYLLVLATIRLGVFGGQRFDYDDVQTFAILMVVPITATSLYFLAVFSFGLSGDLAARQSMYPARMFALPVTSAALAGWPMLYGTIAMAILWLATRHLTIWPVGVDVPVIWPALLGASLLAWTQALTWMPYALPGLRVIVTVLWLMVIETIVMIALELKAPEGVMLALLAPHVPIAYFVARFAVGRARRGDIPDWRRWFARLERIAELLPRRRNQFPSPASAQAWFEWRRHGRSLPALVGIVVPFELALLFVFPDTPVLVFEILVGVMLTPPFMAAFVAVTASKANAHGRDAHGVTPFLATRPLTDAALITAKLKMTVRSTAATWLLVLVAIPLALHLSGTTPMVLGWNRELVEAVGTLRATVFVLLALAGFVASTWKQLVQSLFIGLSGREWVVKASVFATLAFLTIAFPLALWMLDHRAAIAALLRAITPIAAVLVFLKLAAAAWIAIRLHDQRLVSDRTLILGAICWNVAALALHCLLVWLVPTMIIRTYFLALVAILAVPLARLSAAPLAIAWNRHR